MTMLSFKQVESNYCQREPCERGCSWIIKFSHCLNFGYRQYGVIFSIQTQNGCTRSTHEEKYVSSEQFLIFFKEEFHLDVFPRTVIFMDQWPSG